MWGGGAMPTAITGRRAYRATLHLYSGQTKRRVRPHVGLEIEDWRCCAQQHPRVKGSLQYYPPICGARAHCHVERTQRDGHLRSLLRRALDPAPKEPSGAPLPVHSPHHTVKRLVAFGCSVHVARYVAHVLQAIPRLAQEQPAALLLPRADDVARGRKEGGGRRLEAKGGGRGVASALWAGTRGRSSQASRMLCCVWPHEL